MYLYLGVMSPTSLNRRFAFLESFCYDILLSLKSYDILLSLRFYVFVPQLMSGFANINYTYDAQAKIGAHAIRSAEYRFSK